jgi:hypothetical protein
LSLCAQFPQFSDDLAPVKAVGELMAGDGFGEPLANPTSRIRPIK